MQEHSTFYIYASSIKKKECTNMFKIKIIHTLFHKQYAKGYKMKKEVYFMCLVNIAMWL